MLILKITFKMYIYYKVYILLKFIVLILLKFIVLILLLKFIVLILLLFLKNSYSNLIPR